MSIACGHCGGRHDTVDGVKSCATKGTTLVIDGVSFPDPLPYTDTVPTARTHSVPNGYYTIVFNEADDDRITLRVRPHWDEAPAARGEQVVDYLRGPENTSDYTGFAFMTPTRTTVWRKFRGTAQGSRLEAALNVLVKDPGEAGMAYALRSGRCWRCGHLLTVPASIHRGLGPVCAGLV